MSHTVIATEEIRSATTEGVLMTTGTGRHRGSRADEDLCAPKTESEGHGRHRRAAHGSLHAPLEQLRQLVRA